MRGKPVGLVGAATGMSGTIRAQTHLRQMLVFSDAPCLNQPEVLIPRAQERFDADGRLTDESTRALLEKFGAASRPSSSATNRETSGCAVDAVVVAPRGMLCAEPGDGTPLRSGRPELPARTDVRLVQRR